MSGMDSACATDGRSFPNQRSFRLALNWFLNGSIFVGLSLHGNTKWLPCQLASMALLWIFSSQHNLTDAFDDARRWSTKIFGGVALTTYQGMMLALVTWTPRWMPLLWNRLHQLMEEVGGPHWRIGKWLPLAVDGSRGDLARTKALEKRFCAKNYGRGKTAKYRKKKSKGMRRKRNKKAPPQPQAPQMWITLIWHMKLRMPWVWKLGPSDSSERQHLQEMLQEHSFPENTLFCADAGFVGYEFWQAIAASGQHLLMRVGGNVRLLKKLGHIRQREDLVFCWPQKAMQKKQPPLVLRLLTFRSGDQVIHLVTTVLSEQELPNDIARELYRQRWGIELQFRSLKQTFERSKLRCHSPDRALVEMDWSLLGLCVIQLWALREQLQAGQLPEQLSVAEAIRAVRQCLDQLSDRPDAGEGFRSRLRRATIDGYQRKGSKAARYCPNSGSQPSCKSPIITVATKEHNRHLDKHFPQLAGKSFTA